MTDRDTLLKIDREYEREAETEDAPPRGRRSKRTQADVLVELSHDGTFCHDANGDVYARFEIGGHQETHPVRSKGFRRWLTKRFLEVENKPPNRQALETAIGSIEAVAHYESPLEPVFLRVGRHGQRLYLDLGGPAWDVIEIDAQGWRVCPESPCWFRRAPGMRALPLPEIGGSIGDLKTFLNVEHDDDLVLLTCWLVNALFDVGPYPAVVATGEQGAAKSTGVQVLRRLLDPNSSALRSLPREERDLAIAARNGWVIALDNVSSLPDWLSDGLCRIATGGGFSTRQLYSDADEMLFSAMRPIVLNGIEDPVERDDLRDRALFWTLPTIPDEKRRTEREFWRDFDAVHPRILGYLLDGVAAALAGHESARVPRLARMADFHQRATAAEVALGWTPGTFAKAYEENRQNAVELQVEDSRIATELRAIALEGTWTGTASDLLVKLNARVPEEIQRRKWWPKSPRGLSGQVRRAAPGLRRVNIEIEFTREPHGKRTRLITIQVGGNDRPDRPHVAHEHGPTDGLRPPEASDRPPEAPDRPRVRAQPDAADDGDGALPLLADVDESDAGTRAAMREGA